MISPIAMALVFRHCPNLVDRLGQRECPVGSNPNGSSAWHSIRISPFLRKGWRELGSEIKLTKAPSRKFVVRAEHDEEMQTSKDRWRGLATDTSDDQQDITRGKGMVDTLFQAPMGTGTHNAILSSYDYISAGLRRLVIFVRLLEWDSGKNGLCIGSLSMLFL